MEVKVTLTEYLHLNDPLLQLQWFKQWLSLVFGLYVKYNNLLQSLETLVLYQSDYTPVSVGALSTFMSRRERQVQVSLL